MRRFDKKQNILEANLKLEAKNILDKQINSVFGESFVTACLESNYFTNDEKIYMVEEFLPNTNLLTEGPLNWLKDNIFQPVKKAITTGTGKVKDAAISFYEKIKTLITDTKAFFRNIWEAIKSFFIKMFDKAVAIGKSHIEKQKEKVTKKIIEIGKEKLDNEIKQVKGTYEWWFNKGKKEFLNTAEESLNVVESVKKNKWSPEIIDFITKGDLIFEDGGGDKSKVKKVIDAVIGVISWVVKPIAIVLEKIVKSSVGFILKRFSNFTKNVGGPGPYDFEGISHVTAGVIITLFEIAALASGGHIDTEGMDIISKTISTGINIQHEIIHRLVGHLPILGDMTKVVSIIGILVGLYEIFNGIKHIKQTKYDSKDLDKDGDVDSDDEEIFKKQQNAQYYNVPG